jgi:hypothetical protein
MEEGGGEGKIKNMKEKMGKRKKGFLFRWIKKKK